ncbi:MAG: glycoside hydrolase family 9 protein [Defluviitaleaceae bacterium]|nr:glycoside hydrolase family 9 protein [Defluviitaleaceae bacterium]
MKTAWLRINQAGYTPEREKTAAVLSETDISGAVWTLKINGATVLEGRLSSPGRGDDFHVAQDFYYAIDFGAATSPGTYILELENAAPQKIIIAENPYALFAQQALSHLRRMRSGCATDLTAASHPGDAAAIVHTSDGDWQNGAWKEAVPRRFVDMHGGHYDAGDYIKFTLTEANMVWHLLRAYEENSALFADSAVLPAVLDEAKYGLDYLAKTFPDADTFVIQVGDARDHHEERRLAENDALDGKRPALCALSRVHMGMTAAALALGACTFEKINPAAAALYREKAEAIYARAKKSDTQTSAFERDKVNDFYFDRTDADNMALAAAELHRLTGNPEYLADGKSFAPPASFRVSWSEMNGFANHRLAQSGDAAAAERLREEVSRYDCSNLWRIPNTGYTWGSLPIWTGVANVHFLARRLDGDMSQPAMFSGVLDYIFGRNNWGVAMICSPDLPCAVKNMYSWITQVLGKTAVGALSEGPGKKETHDKLSEYFSNPANDPGEKFNTSEAVFYDNSNDFMIQESTIWGQGNLILTLALAT